MKTIGVVGGLGPMATIHYLERIVQLTDAESDQDHPRIYLESIPDIPDRTTYILGKSNKNPYPVIRCAAERLIRNGADFITIPCVTAFYFKEKFAKDLSKPVLSLIDLLVENLQKNKVKKVGIMATTGTIQSEIISKSLHNNGIETVVPDSFYQEQVMEIIYNQIKKGKCADMKMFHNIEKHLLEQEIEKIILGCTELPLVKKEHELGEGYVDVIDILAQEAVKQSGAKVKAKDGWII